MTRRILPFVAIVSLLIIAAAYVFRPLPTTITRENAARIQPGMSVAQVVEILGEPRNETSADPGNATVPPPFGTRRRWVGESLIIVVDSEYAEPFSDNESVVAVHGIVHEFPSAWDFVRWRVQRVLGLAPDRPLGPDPLIVIVD